MVEGFRSGVRPLIFGGVKKSHRRHQRQVLAAIIDTPFKKLRRLDPVLSTPIYDRRANLRLIQYR